MPVYRPKPLTIYTVTVTQKETPPADTRAVNDIVFRFADYRLASDFVRGLPKHVQHSLRHDTTHIDVAYCIDAVNLWMPAS